MQDQKNYKSEKYKFDEKNSSTQNRRNASIKRSIYFYKLESMIECKTKEKNLEFHHDFRNRYKKISYRSQFIKLHVR